MPEKSSLGFRAFEGVSEDAMLRIAALHRMQGEIAAAVAALELALAARTKLGQRKTVEHAKQRLEALARCLALLSSPLPGSCDIGRRLEELVRATWAGQRFDRTVSYAIDLEAVSVDGLLGQRILLIAAELIGNAIRHGLHAGGSTLRIILRRHSNDLYLTVIDDGPGFTEARPFGAAQGIRIAAELAYRGGGALYCTTDDHGACVSVQIPIPPTLGAS